MSFFVIFYVLCIVLYFVMSPILCNNYIYAINTGPLAASGRERDRQTTYNNSASMSCFIKKKKEEEEEKTTFYPTFLPIIIIMLNN